MSVVLRCAICGTQGHTGECEACSEGEVQYFCTNHNQGIWLDGPVCSRCEAKFGDPPRRPAPAPTPPPVLAGRAEAPRLQPPARCRTPGRPPHPDFGRRPTRRPDPDDPADRRWCRGRHRWESCSRRSPRRVLAAARLPRWTRRLGRTAPARCRIPARRMSDQDSRTRMSAVPRLRCFSLLLFGGLIGR